MERKFSNKHKPDFFTLALIFVIIAFGLVMLTSASSELAKIKFGDSYHYLSHQFFMGFLPGLIGFLFFSNISYTNFKKTSLYFFIFNIFLLLLVFSPIGVTEGGSSRWIDLGGFVFQPSELLKISMVLYLAAWLSSDEKRKKTFWGGVVPFLGICGVISLLLLAQPATSIIFILMTTALAMYIASGARFSYISGIILLSASLFLIVSYMTPYRWQRITSFFNPDQNVLGASYHINQAFIAIGSGNLFGVGYGQSTTKINYLPEPIGDSIFAVIAEELGFMGSFFLILLFLMLIIRIFLLASRTHDQFGQILLVGFGALIAIQSAVNIAAISGLFPLTGMPLPFISYGGTALTVFMAISGIIINISKNN